MNAKKIMGAVLVAFLAAALFIGAGAAATAVADGKTVFVNQKLDSTNYSGNWIGSNGAVTPTPADGGVYFPAGTEGVYTLKNGTAEYTLTVKYPEVLISGIAGEGVSAYKFIGGTYYQGATNVDIAIAPLAGLTNVSVYLTGPNGQEKLVGNATSGADAIETALKSPATPAVGQYSIRAVYNATDFVNGTIYSALVTKPVTFTVAKAGDVSISASVDQVIKSEPIKITITGQPGYTYNVSYDKNAFSITGDQLGLPGVSSVGTVNFSFLMPNTGSVEFVAFGNQVNDTEKMSVQQLLPTKADAPTKSVTVKFAKGTLSAKTEAASYFVGDQVTIVGTSTAGAPNTNYTVNGTNFYYKSAMAVNAEASYEEEGDSVLTFEFKINTSAIASQSPAPVGKKMDVGTYTVTIKAGDVTATIPLTLKQPFISIAEAPEVIVQGEDDVEFIINAEAATEIGYYIFGTNYFKAAQWVDEHPEDDEGKAILNQFIVELTEDDTKKMAAGQYFAVFQHPMYDKEFNVTSTGWTIKVNNVPTIDVQERQTANAAQALCDALDAQGIDDMYVKYSFFVVGEDESFTISDIPTSVAQGETITISGVSTANADNTVTVEMVSTAFAAVPKETVGSAAFILVTTTVAEDGTWEVTLDTSDLNVDEYSLNVACEGTTWKNVKINVVEGAETPDTPDTPDVPDTPDTPDTPTEPTTPGFGALAALAGLGAVAVLLLRRE